MEIKGAYKIAGMQTPFGKGAGFVNGEALHRNPVVERTCRQIQELTEQVLIHVERILRIAAKRVLNAGAQVQNVVADVE